jgi:hypothetical protein
MYVTVQGKKCVCTHLAEGQHAYVRDCQEKTHVYVSKHSQAKEKAKKLRLRVNRGCQAIIRQETQYKREQSKEKNTPNPEKEDLSPVWSPILLRGKSLYG